MSVSHVYSSLVLFFQKHLCILRGFFLAICITGIGWFNPETTVFLLDYAPTPLYVRDRAVVLSNPFIRVVHDACIYLFGHVWGSKIYLGSIFFLSLRLGYIRGKRLKSNFFSKEPLVTVQRLCLISMLIFVCNPFFSARYGTQPGIWLSVVLLGYGILLLVKNWSSGGRKHALWIGIYRGIALMAMAHASFMIGAMMAMYLLTSFRNKNSRKNVLVIGATILLLNANRLRSQGSATLETISSGNAFDEQNKHEFATSEHSGLGPIVTATLGYGFRGEKYGSAFTPTIANTNRRIAGSLLICLAVWGWYTLYTTQTNNKRKKYVYWWGSMLVISLILGIGVASDMLARITNRLYTYIPGYSGLREPQKRIGVYTVLILPLIVLGRGKTFGYVLRHIPLMVYGIATVAVCIARTPGVINAMKGRYLMVNYPQTYAQTRHELITQDGTGTQRLHLPRHSYHQCDRTKKVITNTLERFFMPLEVITADNIEIGNLYTNSSNQRSKDIETFLQTKDITLLQKHGIGGIIFTAKCADYKNYEWLPSLSGANMLSSNDDIVVYTISQ